MGIWITKPALIETEAIVWQQLANRTQSVNRAVGGRLYLTDNRLAFEPNRVDAATGGRRWSARLGSIRTVGTEPRDGNRYNGGLRDRLRVEFADGSVELFVVNRLDKVIAVIREAAARLAE